jgi:hypothetical protein
MLNNYVVLPRVIIDSSENLLQTVRYVVNWAIAVMMFFSFYLYFKDVQK